MQRSPARPRVRTRREQTVTHEAAVIVGHSGGSYTAQRFALDHRDRTLGLVLVGAFHSFAGPGFRELLAVVDELTDPVDLRSFASPGEHLLRAGPAGATRS
jgi:pimeloyl-ACP methyl ester carboxylesterase